MSDITGITYKSCSCVADLSGTLRGWKQSKESLASQYRYELRENGELLVRWSGLYSIYGQVTIIKPPMARIPVSILLEKPNGQETLVVTCNRGPFDDKGCSSFPCLYFILFNYIVNSSIRMAIKSK